MEGPKLIQRTFVMYGLGAAAPGVYTNASTLTVTAKTFPVILRKVGVSAHARDSVTSQNIQGTFRINGWSQLLNNPGLTSTGGSARWAQRFGRLDWVEMYYNLAAQENIIFSVASYLDTVTANQINIDYGLFLIYDCPEDYLSVEGMAGNLS